MSRSDRNYKASAARGRMYGVHGRVNNIRKPVARTGILAPGNTLQQQVAERMAAYRRRGYLIEARAKALGLVQ